MNFWSRRHGWLLLCGICCTVFGPWPETARAEWADLFLKDGRRLRGDVTQTDTEFVLRNAVGEMRYKKADVEKVVPVPGVKFDESSAMGAEPDPRGGPDDKDGKAGEGKGLPVPPPLSERDILRLKLSEFPLRGEVEKTRVRFVEKPGQPDLLNLVLKESEGREELDEATRERLRRGLAQEKLQIILRLTGLKHLDRIQVEGDPGPFEVYRQKVLPLVRKGCASAGCHGGPAATGFRFPQGGTQNEAYAYTTFVLLDRTETRHGPLLKREDPEGSVLLNFMLPAADNEHPHPPVRGGKVAPVLRTVGDRDYRLVVEWIRSLRVPRPEYGLDYQFPSWTTKLPRPPERPAENGAAGAGEKEIPPGPEKEPRKKDEKP